MPLTYTESSFITIMLAYNPLTIEAKSGGLCLQNKFQPFFFSITSTKGEMNVPNPFSPINPLSVRFFSQKELA